MSDDERWEEMKKIAFRMAMRNREMEKDLEELRLLIAQHFFPDEERNQQT